MRGRTFKLFSKLDLLIDISAVREWEEEKKNRLHHICACAQA